MARKITGAAFLSLDGIMQAPGGSTEDPTGGFEEGGWMFKIWNPGIEETLGALFSGDYDLLLGRRTYDIFTSYWPYAETAIGKTHGGDSRDDRRVAAGDGAATDRDLRAHAAGGHQ